MLQTITEGGTFVEGAEGARNLKMMEMNSKPTNWGFGEVS